MCEREKRERKLERFNERRSKVVKLMKTYLKDPFDERYSEN